MNGRGRRCTRANHVNKAGGTNPLDRVMASRAFTGVARSLLDTVELPDEPGVFVMDNPMNNLAPQQAPLVYSLDVKVTGADPTTVRRSPRHTSYGRAKPTSRRAVLEQEAAMKRAPRGQTRPPEWLELYLREKGETSRKEGDKGRSDARVQRDADQRVAKKLGVVSTPLGSAEAGVAWCLPQFQGQGEG